MQKLTIRKADDWHIHLRQGPLLEMAVEQAAIFYKRVLVMPNITPPIGSDEAMLNYKAKIKKLAPNLDALMSFQLHPNQDYKKIHSLKRAGAVSGKYYQQGSTTNSENGINSWHNVIPALEAMEEEKLILSIHAEQPEAFSLDRETLFFPVIERICYRFPKLKIIFEHVSTAAGVSFVKSAPKNVAATITVHHLLYTLDNLLGTKLNPHFFCKPVLKTPQDRQALQEVVLSGHEAFFFGSDSAPHPKEKKESAQAAAGVFSCPVALALLIEFFEKETALEKLESFVSEKGARFYEMPLNEEKMTFIKGKYQVPEIIQGVVPLCAGDTLQWKPIQAET